MVAGDSARGAMYQRLVQVLGEDGAMTLMQELGGIEQLERRLTAFEQSTMARFDQIDAHFEEIDERFEQVDRRFEQVDQRFEQVDQRFEQVDRRLTGLEHQIDVRFHEIVGVLRKEMVDFQRTLFFSMAALILTVGILLVGVLRFV